MQEQHMLDWDHGAPFGGIVAGAWFPLISLLFLSGGFIYGSLFLTYEVTSSKANRSILAELSTAIPSSLLLAIGTLFLFLSFGIYV